MRILSNEEQRKRIENLRYADKTIQNARRRQIIHDYIPGHVFYNLGDYPYPFKIEPDEYDYRILKECSDNGAGLIQVHEEWNDAMRLYGADKYSSFDDKGLDNFVDLCHHFNMKFIPYLSTGYLQITDPDWKQEYFLLDDIPLTEAHYRYSHAYCASPEWRNFILGKMKAVLDRYDFDGLYNDMGNSTLPDSDPSYNPEIEDLLVQAYSLVKERGGIYKVHYGGCKAPPCNEKVYDYLWVGEAVNDIDKTRLTWDFKPYVMPCTDYRFIKMNNPDFEFAQKIPFLQFPVLCYGRPVKGLQGEVEGLDYVHEIRWQYSKQLFEYYNTHKNGPYVYSEWASIPDDNAVPDDIPRWFRYLKLYRPMVEENSVCYLDINESTLFRQKPDSDVYISLFINDRRRLVISNIGKNTKDITLKETWRNRENGIESDTFTINAGKILFLEDMINENAYT